jgi:hypothetical protein
MDLVSFEAYHLLGVGRGETLILAAFREGAYQVLSYRRGALVKLNSGPVSGVYEVPYDAERVVFSRDVAKGAEKSVLVEVPLDSPGEERVLPLDPMRLLSAVDRDGRVYASGSTEKEIALYEVGGEEFRKIASLPGIGWLADARNGLGVGVGMWASEPGKTHIFTVDLSTGEIKAYPEPGSASNPVIAPDGSVIYALEGPRRAELRRLDPSTGRSEPLELEGRDLESYEPSAFNFVGLTRGGEVIATARKHGRSRVFLEGYQLDAPEGIHTTAYEWMGRIAVTHTVARAPPVVWHHDVEPGSRHSGSHDTPAVGVLAEGASVN